MASFQLTSANPDMFYVIKKNPASGMQLREIRKGVAYGWAKDTTYNIYFKDADDEVSFGDQQFDYLNIHRFSSPLIAISVVGEFFGWTVKNVHDLDVHGFENSFEMKTVQVNRIREIRRLVKYFEAFEIELNHKTANIYNVKISSKLSINELLNFVNIFYLFVALNSDEWIQMDDATVQKYLNSILKLDAPYFVRYLFARNFFKSDKSFERFKSQLEETQHHGVLEMTYGDTAKQRKRAITKLLDFNHPIIDVGCGEGFYALDYARRVAPKFYAAIDIDPRLRTLVHNKAEKSGITNLGVFQSFNECVDSFIIPPESPDVIVTEVLEHIELEESKALLKDILTRVDYHQVIVTVPNRDFNKHYFLEDGEMRHLDHKWEPNWEEFKSFILESADPTKIEWLSIGDSIGGVSTSIGCIIRS